MGDRADYYAAAMADESHWRGAIEDAAREQAFRDAQQASLDQRLAAGIRSPRLGVDPSTRPQNPHDVSGYGWMTQRGD